MMADDDTVAWSIFFAEAAERLGVAGIESPKVDARRIVEEAAGVEPSEFHSLLEQPATMRGVSRFDSMLARREGGEPLQYVLGRWGFRYLDLMVDHRALVPRPETEVVAGLAIAEVDRLSSTGQAEVLVADLGTGSGAIGLSVVSECSHARVYLTDWSCDALEVVAANLAGIGRAATRASVHQGSWFEALAPDLAGKLDVIVSNPPYIADDEQLPTVVDDWEPRPALRAGPVGTESLLHITEQSVDWLSPTGVLILEMGPHQTNVISGACSRVGLVPSVHPDLTGRERAIVARRIP